MDVFHSMDVLLIYNSYTRVVRKVRGHIIKGSNVPDFDIHYYISLK